MLFQHKRRKNRGAQRQDKPKSMGDTVEQGTPPSTSSSVSAKKSLSRSKGGTNNATLRGSPTSVVPASFPSHSAQQLKVADVQRLKNHPISRIRESIDQKKFSLSQKRAILSRRIHNLVRTEEQLQQQQQQEEHDHAGGAHEEHEARKSGSDVLIPKAFVWNLPWVVMTSEGGSVTAVSCTYQGPVNEDQQPHGNEGTLEYPDHQHRYVGGWKNGKKFGQGVEVVDNTTSEGASTQQRFEGEFVEDLRHGHGRFAWADGQVYEGDWEYNHRHGEGTHSWPDGRTWTGSWRQGKIHGQGKFTWSNGSVFEGHCVGGKKHGHGQQTWTDGKTYTGDFWNGKQHGDGLLVYPDGRRYRGQFAHDKMEGYGTKLWPDGESYEGEWKRNRCHGQGIRVFSDGSRYMGHWKNGYYHGHGTFYWPNGKVYVGSWYKGQKHGHGVFSFGPNTCKRYEGEYHRGQRQGYGVWTAGDGSQYCGDWKNGKKHGTGVWTDGRSGSVVHYGLWQDGEPLMVTPNVPLTTAAAATKMERAAHAIRIGIEPRQASSPTMLQQRLDQTNRSQQSDGELIPPSPLQGFQTGQLELRSAHVEPIQEEPINVVDEEEPEVEEVENHSQETDETDELEEHGIEEEPETDGDDDAGETETAAGEDEEEGSSASQMQAARLRRESESSNSSSNRRHFEQIAGQLSNEGDDRELDAPQCLQATESERTFLLV